MNKYIIKTDRYNIKYELANNLATKLREKYGFTNVLEIKVIPNSKDWYSEVIVTYIEENDNDK